MDLAREPGADRDLLAQDRGVVVHCHMGVGRTGTVIGAVLVSWGHAPINVAAWLSGVQRARGLRGWPESDWQRDQLDPATA